MIRRPPRSTLFPYRRSSDLVRKRIGNSGPPARNPGASKITEFRSPTVSAARSEEHTSELQSQFHLVCRLLLEKKKKKKINKTNKNIHHKSNKHKSRHTHRFL